MVIVAINPFTNKFVKTFTLSAGIPLSDHLDVTFVLLVVHLLRPVASIK